MTKFLGLFLLGILAVILSGCASVRTYQVQVNGYTEGAAPSLAPGASLFVLEDQKAQNPLLEKEIKAKVEVLLEKHGYVLVPYDRADYYLSFTYGMGTPQAVSVTSPAWSIGWGFGSGYCGPGVSTGIYWPGCGPLYTETQALYDRWLRLTVLEGKYYRDTGKSRTVWVGEARSTGTSSDLREVLNSLLIAAFEQFGQNTGKAVPIQIKQNDPRFSGLERVH
jgi:Domain of unknown function (DUF4136)